MFEDGPGILAIMMMGLRRTLGINRAAEDAGVRFKPFVPHGVHPFDLVIMISDDHKARHAACH
jgi:hypothetical protein